MSKRRWARRFSAVVALVAWLGLGLGAPIVISLYTSDKVGDAVEASPSDAYTISDPITIAAAPAIRVERGTLALVDQQGKSIPSVSVPADGLSGSGHVLRIYNGHLSLDGLKPPTPAPRPGLAPLAEILATGRFEVLSLRRSTVTLDILGNQSMVLTGVDAQIGMRRRGQVTIKGSGLFRGRPVTFDTTAGFGQMELKPGEPPRMPLRLAVKGEGVDFGFEGRLLIERDGLGLIGQGELTVPSIRRAARWLGAYWPAGPGLRDMMVRGQVALSRNTLSFEKAAFRMDGSEATGVVGVRTGGPRPLVFATLAYKHLDAKPYLTGSAGEPEPLTWSSMAAGVLSVPLGLHLDADLRVSAGKVALGGIDLGQSATTVTLKDGRLLADLADLNFNGGSGAGQITADFTGLLPRVTLRGKLERIDAGPLSTALLGRPVLLGEANVVADMAGTGSTLRDLLHGLAGKIAIKVQQGARIGVDLKAFAAAARARGFTGWDPGLRGATSFDEIDLRLHLREGTLLAETVEARTSDGVWSAAGTASLLTERVDLRLAHRAGLKPASTASPTAAVEIKGTIRSPSVSDGLLSDQGKGR